MLILLRKKKQYRNLALTGLGFLFVVVALSPAVIADMPAQNRWPGIVFLFSVSGTIFGVVPLLLLIDYYRSRIAIDGDWLAWQGVWRCDATERR